jgi:sugar/nucleoside kinase (ribokinase family)
MEKLLIIGGASLDTLHFGSRIMRAAGGAGLYTAAAARCFGGKVTMFAPIPDPMPEVFLPLRQGIDWIGPVVHPEVLPQFEIVHHEDGKTELEATFFGEELKLDSEFLPEDLSQVAFVHLTPIGSAQHQLEFLDLCRQRGARRISAGTYPCMVADDPEAVREVFALADISFMNEIEAEQLFGSVGEATTEPGKLLFVTMGDRGVWVNQGQGRTHLPAERVEVLDPTGAGDTFCGATLAGLARGDHPVMAAMRGVSLAAHMITAVGPTALWGEVPREEDNDWVSVNIEQVEQIAKLVDSLPEVKPFNFTGPEYPPVGHPDVLDFFFASTLQQFGFWHASEGRYQAPMIATIDGCEAKGSDYLWRAYHRKLSDDGFYTPQIQAQQTRESMIELFRGDDGSNPMPALDLHLAQACDYGRDMLALDLNPVDIVKNANKSRDPLRVFLEQLDHVGGYKEDPLRKKSALLTLILAQRPEHFLHITNENPVPPIIDYHLMRSCLRVGLLEVDDLSLKKKLRNRALLQMEEEWAVRYAAFKVILSVVDQSGKPMGAVDWFFFNARRRCPEMSVPECERCPIDSVCAHRKELFQPVVRTTFY